ncbi:MAG: M23 family metallopeptidase [Nostoc sp.]|uniref:M23 family metallopeptidase n=1 Tax=Nostoc sp. TaxID=1180 RepID=UPI002FFC5579
MQFSLQKFTYATITSAAIILTSVIAAQAQVNTLGKFPWKAGVSAKVSQTLHIDGLGKSAFDIALPAGTPVLAPIDSKVVWNCVAKGTSNHYAIMLQQANSTRKYTLFHVQGNSENIYNNRQFRAGEQIGVVAADKPNDPSCAVSKGIHLHFGLPTQNEVVDGILFTTILPALNTLLTSSNGAVTPPQATTFQSPSSQLSVSVASVDLTVQAKNLSGRTVYWRMYRSSVGNLPPKPWKGQQLATSNSLTLRNLDGDGDTFKGVYYYTVVSLSPIADGDAAKMRTSCFASSGGIQLCDRASR